MADLTREQYKRKEEALVPLRPVVTLCLVLICIWCFYETSTHGSSLMWIKEHSFVPAKSAFLLDHGHILDALRMMFWSTFYQATIWQLFGNVYFIWVFGATLEPRIGHVPLALIAALSMVGGWFALGATADGTVIEHNFLGAGLLTAGLVGAYMCFFPEKKINPTGMRPRWMVYRDDVKEVRPEETFGVSPNLVLAAFVAYEIGAHFLLQKIPGNFDNMTLLGAVSAYLIGLSACSLLVAMMTSHQDGNPLRRLAMQKYRMLRKLDMTHEEALHGAAQLIHVPYDKVKLWVSEGTGGPIGEAAQFKR